MLGTQLPNPLPLTQPLDDQQVSQAWAWLTWALEQPSHLRVPPPELQHLKPEDWLVLMWELQEMLEERQLSPVQ